MAIIKPILIIFTLFVFFKYIFKSRSALATRLLSIGLLLMVTLLVIFPEFSTFVANLVGVGRGADMLVYLFICFSTVVFFRIYSKTKDLDQQITSIVRIIAISNAEKAEPENSHPVS